MGWVRIHQEDQFIAPVTEGPVVVRDRNHFEFVARFKDKGSYCKMVIHSDFEQCGEPFEFYQEEREGCCKLKEIRHLINQLFDSYEDSSED